MGLFPQGETGQEAGPAPSTAGQRPGGSLHFLRLLPNYAREQVGRRSATSSSALALTRGESASRPFYSRKRKAVTDSGSPTALRENLLPRLRDQSAPGREPY